jgi:hypothetical protein
MCWYVPTCTSTIQLWAERAVGMLYEHYPALGRTSHGDDFEELRCIIINGCCPATAPSFLPMLPRSRQISKRSLLFGACALQRVDLRSISTAAPGSIMLITRRDVIVIVPALVDTSLTPVSRITPSHFRLPRPSTPPQTADHPGTYIRLQYIHTRMRIRPRSPCFSPFRLPLAVVHQLLSFTSVDPSRQGCFLATCHSFLAALEINVSSHSLLDAPSLPTEILTETALKGDRSLRRLLSDGRSLPSLSKTRLLLQHHDHS